MSTTPTRTGNVAVVVDGANLHHALQDLDHARIDLDALTSWAAAFGQRVNQRHWFLPELGTLKEFAAALHRHGFDVHQRPVTRRPDGTRKCDQDVDIAVALLSLPADTDTAVLLTGDGDFTTAAAYLLERGIRVVLLAHAPTRAAAWHDVLDHHDLLDLSVELHRFRFGGSR